MQFTTAIVLALGALAAASPAPTSDIQALAPLAVNAECTPGTYACGADGHSIWVCNTSGNWVFAASCGSRNCNGAACV